MHKNFLDAECSLNSMLWFSFEIGFKNLSQQTGLHVNSLAPLRHRRSKENSILSAEKIKRELGRDPCACLKKAFLYETDIDAESSSSQQSSAVECRGEEADGQAGVALTVSGRGTRRAVTRPRASLPGIHTCAQRVCQGSG